MNDTFIFLTLELEDMLKKLLGEQSTTPQFLNLLRAGIAAHEHAFHCQGLSKEDFIHFISSAWDAGDCLQMMSGNMGAGNDTTRDFRVIESMAYAMSLTGKNKGILP